MPLHSVKEVYSTIEETIAGLGDHVSASTVDTLKKLLEEARASASTPVCPPCPACLSSCAETLIQVGDSTEGLLRVWANLKLVLVLFAIVWVIYGAYKLLLAAKYSVMSTPE